MQAQLPALCFQIAVSPIVNPCRLRSSDILELDTVDLNNTSNEVQSSSDRSVKYFPNMHFFSRLGALRISPMSFDKSPALIIYLDLPNSVADGSSHFRTGPRNPAKAAAPRVFTSV